MVGGNSNGFTSCIPACVAQNGVIRPSYFLNTVRRREFLVPRSMLDSAVFTNKSRRSSQTRDHLRSHIRDT